MAVMNNRRCVHGVSLEGTCAICESLGGRAIQCPVTCPYCKGECKRGFLGHESHRCASNSSHTWKGGEVKVTEEWIERGSKATPVLYLDLDDTVRKGKSALGRFVNKASDVEVFPEVPAILAEYKRNGWRIVAISNQGGVALGILTQEECARAMIETQRQCKGAFDKIAFCVHHPDASDPEFAVCWCRKPRIGLILDAAYGLAAQHNEYYPPHLALFVGDRIEDQECAENAGIKFMWAEQWRADGWQETLEATGYVTINETAEVT